MPGQSPPATRAASAGLRQTWTGLALPRVEDPALLTGRGRFADDLPVRTNTLYAAVLRSPHGHADIQAIDAGKALAMPGVASVITGEDVKRYSSPLMVAVRQPIEHWCLAVDRVRYVGEPVAVVVAESRYVAEDALDLIEVRYRPRPAVVDPEGAQAEGAPLLHAALGSNVVSCRRFRYGEPDAAFAAAHRRVALTVRYPRNACTPIECFVVVAEYDPTEDAYDVLANFQGPFTLHPVMARALRVPGNRLRLRTPRDSGGSFGVKQAVFPYVVLMAVAARKVGRPVKWVEDRLEHLAAATSATNRVSRIEAAVTESGEITALRLDQTDDCGAYLRAPEPASLYRMHGNTTGPYRIRNLEIVNRIVVTNKTPTGLNRGFGGPQVCFPLERLMQRIATEIGLTPLEVIRRNLVRAGEMPYRAAAGALLDSGDYEEAVRRAIDAGALAEIQARRTQARAEGRLYGVGYAAVVEPSISNMGYLSTVLSPEERRRAGPKNGAVAAATVSVDPLGAVGVTVDSAPQGQGHRTVLAQVVADALGLRPEDIHVNVDIDTQKDAWSIAAGNYSSRFAGAVAGVAHLAATRLRTRLGCLAAESFGVPVEQVVFADGRVFPRGSPDRGVPFSRLAAVSHWAPGTLPQGSEPVLRETAAWTPPELAAPNDGDEINSSCAYGFIFDFCGVEVDRDTGHVRIDKYVTMHDAGRILHPAMLDGQVRGAFAHAVGAALYEEFAYAEDGSFLSGTFADYLVPTACEVPEPLILHMESPSPFTPLGAKGIGEGNCMSTPVCIANAVADALGVADLTLPLTPARVAAMIHGEERPPSGGARDETAAVKAPARGLRGSGVRTVPMPPQAVFDLLVDPKAMAAILPGCEAVRTHGPYSYEADVTISVGPVRGRYTARVRLSDLEPPRSLLLSADAAGPLGSGRGAGTVRLEPAPGGTTVRYTYTIEVGGKVAAVGSRMLDGATRVVIGQIFDRLAAPTGGRPSIWTRLRRLLGLTA